MSWEPLDFARYRKLFGVFDAHGYSAEPMVITTNRPDAERWVKYHTEDAPEDDRMNIDLVIAPVRVASGEAWCSYEEPPDA